jgi:uncharacterized iron-regulated protein
MTIHRFAAATAALLASCALPGAGWSPLQFVDARGARLDGIAGLAQRIAAAEVVLLGEVHDNPNGHAARLALIKAVDAAAPRPTAIAMEHFDQPQQGALDRARDEYPGDVEAWITRAGSGSAERWPWTDLRPVLELARDRRWTLYAANLSRAQLRAGGADAVHAEPPELPSELRARLLQLVEDGHCGMLPPQQIAPMARLQQLRDRAMGDTIERARRANPRVLLLAGNGHVRRDFGVPFYLTAGRAPVRVISVGFVEQGDVSELPRQYDYTVFVRPHPRTDPCAALRKGGTADK